MSRHSAHRWGLSYAVGDYSLIRDVIPCSRLIVKIEIVMSDVCPLIWQVVRVDKHVDVGALMEKQ